MFMHRTVLALALLLGLGAPLPAAAAPDDGLPAEAAKFVTNVVDQALAVLKNNALSREERIKQLTDLYIEDFDARGMSLFALGIYAGRTRGQQREAYVDAFKHYVIRQYFSRLEMVGDQFAVSKSSPDGEDIAWVVSGLGSRGDKPYRVEWRVRKTDAGLKIFDIILEGSSLLWIQRAAFANFLQQHNGSIDQLMQLMRVERISQDTPSGG